MLSNIFSLNKSSSDSEFVIVEDSDHRVKALTIDQDAANSPSNSRMATPRNDDGGNIFHDMLEKLHEKCPEAEANFSQFRDHLSNLKAFYCEEGKKLVALCKSEVTSFGAKLNENSQMKAKVGLSFLVLGFSFAAFLGILMVQVPQPELAHAGFPEFPRVRDESINLVDYGGSLLKGAMKAGAACEGELSKAKYELAVVQNRIAELVIDNASLQADKVVSTILQNRRLLALNDSTEDSKARNRSKVTCQHTGNRHQVLPSVDFDLTKISEKWKSQLAFEEQIKKYMNLNVGNNHPSFSSWKAAEPLKTNWSRLHSPLNRQEEVKNVYGSPSNWQRVNREIPTEKWRRPSSPHWEKMDDNLGHARMNRFNFTNTKRFPKVDFEELAKKLRSFKFDEKVNASEAKPYSFRFVDAHAEKIKKMQFDLEMAKLKKLQENPEPAPPSPAPKNSQKIDKAKFDLEMEKLKSFELEREEAQKESFEAQKKRWREILDESMKEHARRVEQESREWMELLKKNAAAPQKELSEAKKREGWKKALEEAAKEYHRMKNRFSSFTGKYEENHFLEMRKKRIDFHLANIRKEEMEEKKSAVDQSIAHKLRRWGPQPPSRAFALASELEADHIQKLVKFREEREALKERRVELDRKTEAFRAQMEKLRASQEARREGLLPEVMQQPPRRLEARTAPLAPVDWDAFHARMERRINGDEQKEERPFLMESDSERLKNLKLEVEMQKWKRERFEAQAEKLRRLYDGFPASFDANKHEERLFGLPNDEQEKDVAVTYGNSVDSEALITELSWRRNSSFGANKCPGSVFYGFEKEGELGDNSYNLEKFNSFQVGARRGD